MGTCRGQVVDPDITTTSARTSLRADEITRGRFAGRGGWLRSRPLGNLCDLSLHTAPRWLNAGELRRLWPVTHTPELKAG